MLGLELLLTSLELPIAPPSSMLGRATAAMRQTFFPSVAQSHRHFEGDKSGPNISLTISVFITPLDVWLTPENKKEIILTQTPFSLNGRKSVVFKLIQKIAEMFKDNGGLQT